MGRELPKDSAESHEMEDVNISDLELVYHVREALTSVQSGDNDNYNQLVAVMHLSGCLDPDNRALLETSLKALSGAVSYIDISHHESLLVSIFGMSMWNSDPDIMDAMKGLIISLAASDGKYVDSCLTMLVSNFTPPSYFLDKLKEPHGIERKHQVLSRVHAALKSISDLVPLAPMRLLPIVLQRMPTVHNKHERLKMIVVYTENMLKLESSTMGEFVRSTMLMAVVDRLIDLDMEIGWDDILHDDFSKGIFEMELEDVEEAADDAEQVGDELPSGFLSRKSLSGNLIAELLDSLMVLTFEHLESCEGTGCLIEVFEILLQSFQITVLNTYKSKFAQFVVFYACALDPENCGLRFATMLADVFVSGLYPPLTSDMLESELSRDFGGLERLDMFFPFDPCLLKKSDSFIRPKFIYWAMVKTAYHGDKEDNSDEDVDEDNGDHLMVDGMGRSPDEQMKMLMRIMEIILWLMGWEGVLMSRILISMSLTMH
ncbi:RNA polymerase I specific transcription initiation factor RRN3 protein [Citrus sinensis]|nr:RNA polymerase I specific transcription initiation factor RRN3 protein [Citrus sinensis]